MTTLREALGLSAAPVRAFMVLGLGWGTFAALVPAIKTRLDAGDAAFGLALMCSAMGLLAALRVAPWLDARAGRASLPLAASVMGLAFVLPALAPSLAALALAMVVLGLASGTTDVLMNTRVSEIEAESGRTLMNLNHGMFSVVYVAGALLGGAGREAGVPLAVVPAVAAVAAFALARGMAGRIAPPEPAELAGAAPRMGSVALWGGLIVLIAFLVESATEVWSALHIERTLGGRAAEGAAGPAIMGATMAFGRLSGQLLAQRLGETRLIGLGCPLAAAGLALAAAAASPAQAYAGFALAGLGASVVAPTALALIGRQVPPAVRSRAIAAATVTGFMAFLVGPSLIGLVSQFAGLRVAFAMVAAILAVTPLLLWPLARAGAPLPAART